MPQPSATGVIREDWERPGDAGETYRSPLMLFYLYVREILAALIAVLGYLFLIARW